MFEDMNKSALAFILFILVFVFCLFFGFSSIFAAVFLGFLIIILFFAGLLLIYDGARTYLLIQKIDNTPTSKVNGAAVGLVELAGKAECRTPITSPISKTKCAYWRVLAQYFVPGKGGGTWSEFFHASSDSMFYLQDETGKMLIDPNSAQVDILNSTVFEGYISGTGDFGTPHPRIGPRVLDYIDTIDDKSRQAFMRCQHKDVRLFEFLVTEGDTLYVLGNAEPRDAAPASPVGYENLVVRQGKDDKIMYLSDSGERKIRERLSYLMWDSIAYGIGISAIMVFFVLFFLSGSR